MTKKSTKELERTRSRIDDDPDDDLPEDDLDLLREFDLALAADGEKGASRHQQLLMYALSFSNARGEHGLSLEALLRDPAAIEDFLTWVNTRLITRNGREKPMSEKTRSHYRGFARQFGKLLTDGDDLPDRFEEIPAGVQRGKDDEYDPTPSRSNIHFWDEHVVPVIDHYTVHTRDSALIAMAWDSGARPWELDDVLLGDLEDRGDYIICTIVDGKTGDRDVRLIPCTPYLRKWIRAHPVNERLDEDEDPTVAAPNVPLWTHQDKVEKLQDLGEVPRTLSERVDIHRPMNLRMYRKSRASILASSPEVTEDALRIRFGWKMDSDAPRYYKAKFGDRADDQIAAADGADVQLAEEHDDPAPVKCPRCDRWTPRHCACLWCEAEFDVENATETAETVLQTELRQKKRDLLAAVAQEDIDPDVLDRALPFADVLDDEPDIVDRAEEFLQEMDS